jgi:6-pyruvoyltetrahydropterin/6-carboxytetrahydropterin synthase
MSVVRVTKEFSFDMAHALPDYEGKCNNIHGHTYWLSVTVSGKPIPPDVDDTTGMVIDFSDLKKIIVDAIIDPFDHALVVWFGDDRFRKLSQFPHVLFTPYHPTCENLLMDFVGRLSRIFNKQVKLKCVVLRETPTSYASWYAEDNES